MIFTRPCKRKECQGKQCRHKHFHYRFRVNGVRYRGAIPEARTKWDAEQAEDRIKRDIFGRKYGTQATGKDNLGEFIEREYLPHAKANKRSFKNDGSRSKVVIARFGNKSFRDITPEMIEKFKCDLAGSITRRGTKRSQADVNRHLEFVSAVFELAIQYRRVSLNPCRQVKHFKEDNERTRYLLPDEEKRLLQNLIGRRKHLKPLVIVALGTGLRKRELLDLRRDQIDFSRSLVIASHTKGKKNREIPMNAQVHDVLWIACRGRGMNDYIFPNPQTGKPYTDIKHSFDTACTNAGIEGLWWIRPAGHVRHKAGGGRSRNEYNHGSYGPPGPEDMFALREGHRPGKAGSCPVCLPTGWTQNGHTASRRCLAVARK